MAGEPEWYIEGQRHRPVVVRWRIARWRPPAAFWVALLLVAAAFLAAWSAMALDRAFRPALLAIAEAKARDLANQAMQRAVAAEVLDGVRYEDLIRVVTDRQGERVLLLQPDSVAINRLVGRANRAVQGALGELDGQSVSIPVGQALGYGLFGGGAGPELRLRLRPVGSVRSAVRSEFRGAGVNQTHHQVILEMRATVRVVSPLVSGEVEAPFQTVLTEAVINGEVPQVMPWPAPVDR